MQNENNQPIFLIINADDYGFFPSVSRGIVYCAKQGVVTAIGIMANGPQFDSLVGKLHDLSQISFGIHLNVTYGKPISKDCAQYLEATGGFFPGKFKTAGMVIKKQLPVSAVMAEWRAQIERCFDSGLDIRFLNTHEHIHLLPPLAGPILGIAQEYGIRHVRHPEPEWKTRPLTCNAFLRNFLIQITNFFNRTHRSYLPIPVIGIAASGKLTTEYLDQRFGLLKPGKTYELMCHPGYHDPGTIRDPALTRFHSWNEELELLTSNTFKTLLKSYNIKLSGF